MDDHAYPKVLEKVQSSMLGFLRALEDVQQSVQFDRIGDAQQQLQDAAGDSLAHATAALKSASAPAAGKALDEDVRQALVHLTNALHMFIVKTGGADFGMSFMSSRGQQCRALEILYRRRLELDVIEPYFRMSDDTRSAELLGDNAPSLGLSHHERSAAHNNYSLYVPEYYDPEKEWPLIVCLHGGYGNGDEYIWSWLRIARSKGYVLLAPKSIAPTWSIVQPPLDVKSITLMMDQISASYAIDKSRLYLSGLSDGGTFSYLLGLCHADRFCGVAPIAGVLSQAADTMLRAKQGKELPLHVIHGAHDMIFPVQSVRSTNELLHSLGYQLTYTELPDWGHALTYSINEELVLPWFEQLDAVN